MVKTGMQSSVRILRQLYFLRNITITFITLMVVLALFGLHIKLPVIPLSSILLIMAVTNLVTRFFVDSQKPVSERMIFAQLLVEILSFSLILYFAGGATNPFTFFYLIPLAISATVIPGRLTWALTLVTVSLYSLLLEYYVPLTYAMHDHQQMGMNNTHQFDQHVLGMWFGFMVSALLVTWFITYLANELKRRDRAIAEARQRELRDQQMVALGTLAAGTAHELGTPLASLAIISGEITDGYDPEENPELYDNQRILREQIARCKTILSGLSESAGEVRADEGYLVPLEQFVEKTLQRWELQSADTRYRLTSPEPVPEVFLLYDTTIAQAVINLFNNAVESCEEPIEIKINANARQVEIVIIDHGPGISDEFIALAGESSFSDKEDGLGIGLFLAINTLRRCGGTVNFQRLPQRGTKTVIRLPISDKQS
jgi:two-component system sensor histidine kinase RegB